MTKVSPAAGLLQWWSRLKSKPGGKALFALILAAGVPYSSTARPQVLVIEPGFARVQLKDRRRVRNHLNSIHAIALANVGELTSGLAMTATLPADVRSILTALHVEYKKKARGTLIAECRCTVPPVTASVEHLVTANVMDAAGDIVATITATWKLSRLS